MDVYKERNSSNKILTGDINEYLHVTYHISAKVLKLCSYNSINSLKSIGHYMYAKFTA